MKTSSHFSSKNSALVLGTVLTASTLFAGFTLAQSALSIPTNLSNAVITIQKIVLSTVGTNALLSNPGSTIALDGANGNITTQPPTAGGVGGDVTIGGFLQFTKSDYLCGIASGTSGSTECVLKVDTAGRVSITDQFSGASTDDNIFERTPGTATNQRNNIYLSLEDGEATVAGRPDNTTSFLRVGAGLRTDSTEPSKDDTAMVVGGVVESRGGIYIKKNNNDAELSNSSNNRIARLDDNFTALDLNTREGRINFTSSYSDGAGNDQPTLFNFSADNATTKVGINFNSASSNTIQRTPGAELHVAQDGVFMVGGVPGAPSFCDTSGMCTADVGTNTFMADSTTRRVGIGVSDPSGPDANLHVAEMDGTFLVGGGSAEGQCVRTDASNAWLSSYISRCTNTQACQDLHGAQAVCTLDSYVVGTAGITTDPTALSANNSTRRVGVKTFAPVKDFDVRGTASVSTSLIVGHTPNFDPGTDILAVNGNTRANAYYYNSDRRYKSDIVALSSPLKNLLKISGYHYYSTLEKKDTMGVIAQEVEAVYPELVQTDSQGYKSVQYGNLVAPIIEAIRELATKIDNLFTLYVSQQAKIDTLEARLLKLEAQLK